MPMNERNFSAVPETACRLSGGEVMFRDNGPNAKSAGVQLRARSGQAIDHWFWGRVVHDFSGCRHKPRIAVDYAHNDAEVLGYVNHFDSESGDLMLSGALTPWHDKDRASEVIFKMREGVPYEASIFFGGDGIKIEEVGTGMVAQVNGYQFEGPGIIIREWPLRGVAICPYGADQNTESAALSGGKTYAAMLARTEKENEVKAEAEVVVEAETVLEAPVAVEAPVVEAEAQPAPVKAAELTGPKPVPVAPDPREEFRRIKAAFGAEIAAEVFESGGGYVEAQALAYEKTKVENESLRARLAEVADRGGQAAAFAATEGRADNPWKAAQKKG
jgi:hypothetical protein